MSVVFPIIVHTAMYGVINMHVCVMCHSDIIHTYVITCVIEKGTTTHATYLP